MVVVLMKITLNNDKSGKIFESELLKCEQSGKLTYVTFTVKKCTRTTRYLYGYHLPQYTYTYKSNVIS